MIDHFGFLAPFYDRVIPSPDLARLRGRLRLPTAGRLLDAGGGTGRVSSHLRHLVDEIEEPDIHRLIVKFVALGEKAALMRSRFYTAEQIHDMIAAHDLPVTIERNGQFSAWVIVDK